MLLKGPHSHTSSNAQITSFQLVFYVTHSHTSSNAQITSFRLVFYVTGLAPTLLVLPHLLVHDWYYVQVY
jgi:hypothetical protein